MKSLIATLLLLAITGPASAANEMSWSSFNDDYPVEILNWCEGSKLMYQSSEGKTVEQFNCEDYGQVCKMYDSYRMNRVIYSARCEAKN